MVEVDYYLNKRRRMYFSCHVVLHNQRNTLLDESSTQAALSLRRARPTVETRASTLHPLATVRRHVPFKHPSRCTFRISLVTYDKYHSIQTTFDKSGSKHPLSFQARLTVPMTNHP